jgi:LacI family transcriptional regulator
MLALEEHFPFNDLRKRSALVESYSRFVPYFDFFHKFFTFFVDKGKKPWYKYTVSEHNMNKPTIKAIAEKAGVSRGTVDRVLHGRPNVKAHKREKVLDLLKEFNFTPNPAARALALKVKNMKIAALLPCWTGAFEEEVLKGIEMARKELQNYHIEVLMERCQTDQPQECIEKIDKLTAAGIHGLAICAQDIALIREKLHTITQKGMPVVTFNSDIPGSGRLCFIGQDLIKEGRLCGEIMTKMLPEDPIQHAHTLIVCGNLEFYAHHSRVEGFRSKYRELGFPPESYTVIETYNDYRITFEKVGKCLAENPHIKGIYMANESVAGCVDAIKQAQIRVRVVCHDLSTVTALFLRDRTVDFVIEQDMQSQGFLPFKIIAELLIEGNKPKKIINYSRINIIGMENVD